jgi:hypothetical protein
MASAISNQSAAHEALPGGSQGSGRSEAALFEGGDGADAQPDAALVVLGIVVLD